MNSELLNQNATYEEIIGQPYAWAQAVSVVADQAEAIASLLAHQNYSQILFTGCGSTYYLSLAAAALTQSLSGITARAVPAGELVMYPETGFPMQGKVLLVAVSRSAETTETVAAVRNFQKQNRGDVVVVSNYPDLALTKMGGLNLIIPSGQELSIAQTRSFASMYVACTGLAVLLAGKHEQIHLLKSLPEAGRRLIQSFEPIGLEWGTNLNLDRFYFLGSGPRYGLACEANLKMKEMSLTHSEAFHFLEFRHGPISMVNSQALVIGLLSEKNRELEEAVLENARALGGNILTLSERDADIHFESGIAESLRNVLYLPVLQLMSYYRAQAKGLNPDRPNNLNAVVKLAL